jgi:uncharacterized protein with GYD domain
MRRHLEVMKGDSPMPTYVALINYTQQGIANIKEGPARAAAAKEAVKAAGGEWKGFYLTMGQYDAVAIMEAPDDETLAKIVLTLNSRGNSRSETLRAFTEDEFRQIVAALG